MSSSSILIRTSHRLKAIGLLGLFILSLASVSRAELLFDRGGGGPNQYNGLGNVHYAGFTITEGIRITQIAGWFFRTTEPFQINLRLSNLTGFAPEEPPFFPIFDSFLFHPFSTPPAGAGGWAGSETLSWDLRPGSYGLRIEGPGMPFALGNFVDPLVRSKPFDYQGSFYDWDPETIFQGYDFGLRIHGTALTAVPEPSTIGVAGAMMLLAVVAYRKRQASRRLPRLA